MQLPSYAHEPPQKSFYCWKEKLHCCNILDLNWIHSIIFTSYFPIGCVIRSSDNKIRRLEYDSILLFTDCLYVHNVYFNTITSIICYYFLLILILCLVVCLFKSSSKVFNLADFNVYTSNFVVGADTFYLFFNILLSCPIPILKVLSIR